MTERIVYKYPLNPGMTTLSLPTRATLLHVAYQGEQLQLWALVNPASPIDERTVLVQATPLRGTDAADRYLFSAVDISPSHRALQALIDTGISLSRTIALDRVFAEVGLQLRRALACDAFAIAVADDDTAALRIAGTGGYDETTEQLESRLAPIWVDALANGRVVFQHGPHGPEVTAPMTSASVSVTERSGRTWVARFSATTMTAPTGPSRSNRRRRSVGPA